MIWVALYAVYFIVTRVVGFILYGYYGGEFSLHRHQDHDMVIIFASAPFMDLILIPAMLLFLSIILAVMIPSTLVGGLIHIGKTFRKAKE